MTSIYKGTPSDLRIQIPPKLPPNEKILPPPQPKQELTAKQEFAATLHQHCDESTKSFYLSNKKLKNQTMNTLMNINERTKKIESSYDDQKQDIIQNVMVLQNALSDLADTIRKLIHLVEDVPGETKANSQSVTA